MKCKTCGYEVKTNEAVRCPRCNSIIYPYKKCSDCNKCLLPSKKAKSKAHK